MISHMKAWSAAVILGAGVTCGTSVAKGGAVGFAVEPEHHTISADYNAAASASLGAGKFVYDLWISGGAELRDLVGADDNAYVTIFDFAGLIGTPTFTMDADVAGAGFTTLITTPWLGGAPDGVTPAFDAGDVPNITIDFLNPDANGVFGSADDRSLGQLVLESKYTGTVELEQNVASFDYRTSRGQLRTNKSLTDTTVPQAVAVPLPAAAWGGLAVLGLVMRAQARRRRR